MQRSNHFLPGFGGLIRKKDCGSLTSYSRTMPSNVGSLCGRSAAAPQKYVSSKCHSSTLKASDARCSKPGMSKRCRRRSLGQWCCSVFSAGGKSSTRQKAYTLPTQSATHDFVPHALKAGHKLRHSNDDSISASKNEFIEFIEVSTGRFWRISLDNRRNGTTSSSPKRSPLGPFARRPLIRGPRSTG
jgi:hypothetical protein